MKLHPLILALGLTPLMGCSDGGGGSTPEPTATYNVRAVDGYLRNALVWLDINGDFQLSDGEPQALSTDGGLAELDVEGIDNPEQYSVIVKAVAGQTVDEDTITESNPEGVATTTPFLLSAPAGQTVVTPLSTLVNIKMNNGLDQQQATAEVAADLGIPEETLLGDYIAAEQGDIAAKANALVELDVLPESEQQMQEMNQDESVLDDQLEEHLEDVQSLTEEQRLVVGEDGSVIVATNIDSDDDGVIDEKDAFPEDVSEWLDSDKDGMGDNADAFPTDATETVDTDGDGTGDNADVFPEDATEIADTDGDGTGDNADAFPTDATETADTDGDGTGDNADAFPTDATETVDTDGDGTGDNSDAFPTDATEVADSDNDGMGDNADAFPTDATETADTDTDGTGDNSDAFPTDPNESADTDNDGMGDNADAFPEDATETVDTDTDGTGDNSDAFPTDPNESADTDNDGTGDNADAFPNDATETIDTDGDGTGDNSDAFPADATETVDTDEDGIGDNSDAFPTDATESVDTDGDGIGDNSDPFPEEAALLEACRIGDDVWDDDQHSATEPSDTLSDYAQTVTDCEPGDSSFTEALLSGPNLDKTSEWILGDTYDVNGTLTFEADEEIHFYPNGTGAYIDEQDGEFGFNWSISNGQLSLEMTRSGYEGSEELSTLIASNGTYYSVKSFWRDLTGEDYPAPSDENQGDVNSFIMKFVTYSDEEATSTPLEACRIGDDVWDDDQHSTTEPSDTLSDYEQTVTDCEPGDSSFTEALLSGPNLDKTSEWIVDDEKMHFYPNGTGAYIDEQDGEFGFNWSIGNGQLSLEMTRSGYEGSEELLTLINSDGTYYSIKSFWRDLTGEEYPAPSDANQGDVNSFIMKFVTYSDEETTSTPLAACRIGDDVWDDDQHSTTEPSDTLSDYEQTVTDCEPGDTSFTEALLSGPNLDKKSEWILGDTYDVNGTLTFEEDEKIHFYPNGTGAYIDDEDGEFGFNWSISNGQLSLEMTASGYEGSEELNTLIASNGTYFSIKSFWRDLTGDDYPAPSNENQGDVHSFIMKFVTYSEEASELVGAWYMGDSNTSDNVTVTFYDNGYYAMAHDSEIAGDGCDEAGCPGMERGTYSWDEDSGTFQTSAIRDTNGEWGFSDIDGGGINTNDNVSISISDNTFSLIVPTEGTFVFTKANDVEGSIVGAWYMGDADTSDNITVTFYDNGYYTMAHDSEIAGDGCDEAGCPGMERGTYSWDEDTGEFHSSVIRDTNGEWGFSDMNDDVGLSITISDNTLSLIIPTEGTAVFTRVVDSL